MLFSPYTTEGQVREGLCRLFEAETPLPIGLSPQQLLLWMRNYSQAHWYLGKVRADAGSPLWRSDGTDPTLRDMLRPLGFVDAELPIPPYEDAESSNVSVVSGGTPRLQILRYQDAAMLLNGGVSDALLMLAGGPNSQACTLEELSNPHIAPIREGWEPPSSMGDSEADWTWFVFDRFQLNACGRQAPTQLIKGPRLVSQMDGVLAEVQRMFPGKPTHLIFHTIQPHAAFQGIILHRRLLGTPNIKFTIRAVAATQSRHDNGYLLDGVTRALHQFWKAEQDGIVIPSTWRE